MSVLWKLVRTLKLNINIRFELQNDQAGDIFSKQMLDIGNGEIPIDISTGFIRFPENYCQFADSMIDLIKKVFPNIAQNYNNHVLLSERAILAAKNNYGNELNIKIQSEIAGELITYKSMDTLTIQEDVLNYPTEFLNSLKLPPHNLQLKVGSAIIMLRNINPPLICNGTRLAVKKLMNNVIAATILKGKYKGVDTAHPNDSN